MTSGRTLAVLLLGTILVLSLACESGGAGRLAPLAIQTGSGQTTTLRVEIADTPAELERGLSGREALLADRGMLFVIGQRGPGFWNKDVAFSLSVAFISKCGAILDIQHMDAYSLELRDTPHEFKFGLEVNRGWFERHGVGIGDRVRLPRALKTAGCVE